MRGVVAASLLLLTTLLLGPAVDAYIKFYDVNNTKSVQLPTYDYFEAKSPYQNRTKCIVTQVKPVLVNGKGEGCKFQPAPVLKGYDLNGPYTLDYPCTIAFLDQLYGIVAGCRNIMEMVTAVKEQWVPTLPDVDMPLDTTVFIILARPLNYTGTLAGPVDTPYLSHSFTIGDGIPPLPVVFATSNDVAAMVAQFSSVVEVVADVFPEPGPWNTTFLSAGYIAYRWVIFGLLCIMVIVSLYRLFLATAQGTVKWDQRTAIFISGLISAIMYAVAMTVRRQTQLFFLLELLSQFIFSVAFFLLLLLWSGILQQVQKGKPLTPLRVGILLALLVVIFNLIASLVWLLDWPSPTMGRIHEATRYIVPVSQLIVGFLFLFYAIRFQLRKGSFNTSRDTRRALTKLSWLAILGFLTFIIKAVTNFVGGDQSVYTNVAGLVSVYVLEDLASLLRVFAILMILGVRLPEQRSSTSTTTSQHGGTTTNSSGARTLLSWGGWSRGWRRALYGSSMRQGNTTMDMSQQSTSDLMSSTGYTAPNKRGSKAQRMSVISSNSGVSYGGMRSAVTPTTAVSLQASSGRQRKQRGDY